MNLNNLKYTQDHEWIRIDGDIAYVGITDFARANDYCGVRCQFLRYFHLMWYRRYSQMSEMKIVV